MSSTPYIHVGTIVAAHGLKGEVKIRSFLQSADELAAYGTLLTRDGTPLFSIKIRTTNNDIAIAAVDGVSDRNSAEKLVRKELYLSKDAFPALKPSQFYHSDLVGLKVSDTSGNAFGEVVGVHNYGAGDLLEIKLEGSSHTEFFLFNDATFPAVDIAGRTAIISPPEYIETGEKT